MTGPDRDEVRRLAGEVGEVMRATPEVSNVHNDWLEPVPSLKLDIDQDRARALGVTSQSVRRSLQAMLSGFQIGEFRDERRDHQGDAARAFATRAICFRPWTTSM